MFELLMTYCLVGQPCVNETVANFPQYDVGEHICELAKPAVERGVRARSPASTRITFVCQQASGGGEAVEYEYQTPSRERSPDLLNGLLQQFGGYLR
jgi:hypothetical protein